MTSAYELRALSRNARRTVEASPSEMPRRPYQAEGRVQEAGHAYIVYGPMACGKTRNAQAISLKLTGAPDRIIDDWRAPQGLRPGHVHFTADEGLATLVAETLPWVTAVEFSSLDLGPVGSRA